jgi:hypothetical protein
METVVRRTEICGNERVCRLLGAGMSRMGIAVVVYRRRVFFPSLSYDRKLSIFFRPFFDPWLFWPEFEERVPMNAEYTLCESRGFWWKPEKALGEVVPVGKKPDEGEGGGEK